MTELTNEQKARVFAMYWGCRAYRVVRKTGELTERDDYSPVNPDLMEYINKSQSTWSYKLCLTPLSAISDEHAIEVAKLCDDREFNEYSIKRSFFADPMIRIHLANEHSAFDFEIHSDYDVRFCRCGTYSNFPMTYEAVQHLIQQGYAVPLFIEVGHPLNGKTAIQLGIAIDKTTLK